MPSLSPLWSHCSSQRRHQRSPLAILERLREVWLLSSAAGEENRPQQIRRWCSGPLLPVLVRYVGLSAAQQSRTTKISSEVRWFLPEAPNCFCLWHYVALAPRRSLTGANPAFPNKSAKMKPIPVGRILPAARVFSLISGRLPMQQISRVCSVIVHQRR